MNSYTGVRVLVTGADGFIGSHVVAALRARGAQVYAAVRSKQNATALGGLSGVEIREGDLSDEAAVKDLFVQSRPEIVFNAASTTNVERTLEHAEDIIRNTYGIARNMLSVAAGSNVRRFIQFGSIEEYGTAVAPFSELVREEPISPYSFGKIASTQFALLVARRSNLQVCVVRPAATFGPGQRFSMLIPVLIRAGLEGRDFDMNPGEQLRDFIYVNDLVEGVLACGMHEKAAGEIINLGSNRGTKVKEVALTVNELLGNPIAINFGAQPYRTGDSMSFYMNSEKAKQLLGWEPKTLLRDALTETVAWYRANR